MSPFLQAICNCSWFQSKYVGNICLWPPRLERSLSNLSAAWLWRNHHFNFMYVALLNLGMNQDGSSPPPNLSPVAKVTEDGRMIRVPWFIQRIPTAILIWKPFMPEHLCHILHACKPKVKCLDQAERDKIRDMSSKSLRIEERRVLYNALARRMQNPVGLSPGLVEKYAACAGCNKKRFELLKEFMLDQDMFLACACLERLIMPVQHACSDLTAMCSHSVSQRKEVEIEAYFVQLYPQFLRNAHLHECTCEEFRKEIEYLMISKKKLQIILVPWQGIREKEQRGLWGYATLPHRADIWRDGGRAETWIASAMNSSHVFTHEITWPFQHYII